MTLRDETPAMAVRPTARLIVLDQMDRVLLFKVEDDNVLDLLHPLGAAQSRIFWCTPGGGVEEGETFEDAARRELREETGLAPTELGPCLLERELLLRVFGQDMLIQERYFLARVETSDVTLDGFSALEQAVYRDHRWWTLDALETTDEQIFPVELADVLRRESSVVNKPIADSR